jgi:hypothetical protein
MEEEEEGTRRPHMAARSLLTIYENGPAVKSIVGAPPGLVSLVASGQTPAEPARQPDGWFTIAEVLRQRHGSVV